MAVESASPSGSAEIEDSARKEWPDPSFEFSLYKRAMFITDSGYIGLAGYPFIEPEDQVVIFDGDTTPIVLRHEDAEEEGDVERWQIVGDCYLHRWMDGDYFGRRVVDPAEAQDSDRAEVLVRQEFAII